MRKEALLLAVTLAVTLVLLSGTVSAFVDIPYSFNVDTAEIVAVDCLNDDCSSVRPFSGSFPNGATATDGTITVRYPSTLTTPYGYGILYYSKGYLPMAYKASWHNNGHDTIQTASPFSISFEQKPSCKAHVDNFKVSTDAYENVPLIVSFDASLDADVHSALSMTSALGYVPESKKQEYYGVDTIVTMKVVTEGGQLIHTATKRLTAKDGTALLASTSQRVEFSWTPETSGKYVITISTEVSDEQCTTKEDSKASKDLTVLSTLPKNSCYTIANSLDTSKKEFVQNEKASFTFTTYSAHADPQGTRTPLPTTATYTITSPTGKKTTGTLNIPAGNNPSTSTVNFLALEKGLYGITVTGTPESDTACKGLALYPETLGASVNIVPEKTFKATFQVVDNKNGAYLKGAIIIINGRTTSTDIQGSAALTGFTPGTYTYTVARTGYETYKGTLTIKDYNIDVFLSLNRLEGTEAPTLDAPTIPEQQFADITLDEIKTRDYTSIKQGSIATTTVQLTNRGTTKETLRVAVYSLSVPAISSVRSLELPAGTTKSATLALRIPETSRTGKHWYAVSAWSDTAGTNAHRFITIVEG